MPPADLKYGSAVERESQRKDTRQDTLVIIDAHRRAHIGYDDDVQWHIRQTVPIPGLSPVLTDIRELIDDDAADAYAETVTSQGHAAGDEQIIARVEWDPETESACVTSWNLDCPVLPVHREHMDDATIPARDLNDRTDSDDQDDELTIGIDRDDVIRAYQATHWTAAPHTQVHVHVSTGDTVIAKHHSSVGYVAVDADTFIAADPTDPNEFIDGATLQPTAADLGTWSDKIELRNKIPAGDSPTGDAIRVEYE